MSAQEERETVSSMASLDISPTDPTQHSPSTSTSTSTHHIPTPPPPPSSSASAAPTTIPPTTIPLSILPLRPSAPLHNEQRSDPTLFGTRHLTPDKHVFSANAWDHVEPDAAHHAHAAAQYALQRAHAVAPHDRRRIAAAPERWWDAFYTRNAANFFKDRRWLRQEFGALAACTAAPEVWAAENSNDGGGVSGGGGRGGTRQPCVVLEVGAGAGNTAFPLLEGNANPEFMLHACDFSKKAVQLLKAHELFDEKHMRAEVWDVASTSQPLPPGVLPGSVDVVVLIFVFSALAPSQWAQAVRNVWLALRIGGEVCFRDYGRGDLAQVRFRKGRFLAENFYVRGDGTRVYFFDETELTKIWGGGLMELRKKMVEEEAELDHHESVDEHSKDGGSQDNSSIDHGPVPAFKIERLGVDRRLLVNRQKQLKMYRCWMQASFRKTAEASQSLEYGVQPLMEQKISAEG